MADEVPETLSGAQGEWVGGQETAHNVGAHSTRKLSVTEAEVIRFLRTLRDNGTPAWQRLQAVRAVEWYRNLVLKTKQPDLHEIRQTLGRLADRERAAGGGSAGLSADEQRQLVGIFDPREPAILQQMRRELRLRHLARGTEKAYVGWVRRFITHCGSEDLQQFGEPQIRSFLSQTMYGAGLRHAECRRLRVKDVCFDEGHIVVRNGKGDKDRITVLPDRFGQCRNCWGTRTSPRQ